MDNLSKHTFKELSNNFFDMALDEQNGLIRELRTRPDGFNIADKSIGFGGVRYTLNTDDVRTDESYTAYKDRLACYDEVSVDSNKAVCVNRALSVHTEYTLESDGLILTAFSENADISQFGIDLNFNFLGKKNGTYEGQLIPTSPYDSTVGNRQYFIMSVINGGLCAVVSLEPGYMWKIDYSPYCYGHFITGFQIMSSPDKIFAAEGKKSLKLKIVFAQTAEKLYEKIQRIFGLPMAIPQITGSFENKLCVDILGESDCVKVISESREELIPVIGGKAQVNRLNYGRHTVIPYIDGREGLDTQIWFGDDIKTLFEKSCNTITGSNHGDDNMCEGTVWCWSLISYMNTYGDKKYLNKVRSALKKVMCEECEPIQGQTIVPYSVNGMPPYLIYKSHRIQEQFFGISMLTDMYKLTGEKKYIDFAEKSARAVLSLYQRDNGGLIVSKDYTTVCAPIIAIVDLALIFKDTSPEKYAFFAESAKRIADFLVERGFDFPTEGDETDITDEEMEEGSISCTALSVLYYCRYIENNRKYIDFARDILDFHENWVSCSPDVKLYRSTMRWWETIWEGDATGPSVCAGHAWSVWRAEADYHMAVLTGESEYFKKSLNSFMCNFSKINKNGESYTSYVPDYIPGGGDSSIKSERKQLRGEDHSKKYEIAHNYPKHFDDSLSRYVWVRASATWLKDRGGF